MAKPIRVAFFGTPPFSIPCLQMLTNDNRFVVVAVISQAGKPVGRDHIMTDSAVTQYARQNNISFLLPASLKTEDFKNKFDALEVDIAVVIAYGRIIPQAILDIPRYGFVNIHGSLLPQYRGASPIQYALMNGDEQTGITIMLMNNKMDEGDILYQSKTMIAPSDTYETLAHKLSQQAAQDVADIIMKYIAGTLQPVKQDYKKATYTKLITRDMGKIDWKKDDAKTLMHRLHAFTPWPGIYAIWKKKRVKILDASYEEGEVSPVIGKVVGNRKIQTIEGFLIPRLVQIEGKSPVSFQDFLHGCQKEDIVFT